jgi:hypothetical protein
MEQTLRGMIEPPPHGAGKPEEPGSSSSSSQGMFGSLMNVLMSMRAAEDEKAEKAKEKPRAKRSASRSSETSTKKKKKSSKDKRRRSSAQGRGDADRKNRNRRHQKRQNGVDHRALHRFRAGKRKNEAVSRTRRAARWCP